MSTQYRYQVGGQPGNGGGGRSPFSGLIGIAVAILFLVALFSFLNFLFWLLWKILPIILIAVVVIDHKVILDYFGWLGRLFKRNWIMGIVAGGLSLAAAPLVSVFLLGKALLRKKIKTVKEEVERKREGEFVEYEEIDSEVLYLPKLEAEPKPESRPQEDPLKQQGNQYDNLF